MYLNLKVLSNDYRRREKMTKNTYQFIIYTTLEVRDAFNKVVAEMKSKNPQKRRGEILLALITFYEENKNQECDAI